MRYCIVRKIDGVWHAWNQEARLIGRRPSWNELTAMLDELGYQRVSTATRAGATIADKLWHGMGESIVARLLQKE